MSFKLKSTAFGEGETVPKKYTCEGSDLSPELIWNDPPAGTAEFVLINDDPDAPRGTWVHWVLYNIPGNRQDLPEGVSKGDQVAGIGTQGRNDFGFNGYGGPCPPPGKPHRYFFKLYALSKSLNLKPGMTKDQVVQAVQGSVLEETQLMGTYAR